MEFKLNLCGLLTAAALTLSAAQGATLTGAIHFSTDNTGAAFGGQIWNTLGGDPIFNLFLSTDAAGTNFINGSTDLLAGINIPLLGGSNTFYIWAQPGSPTGFTGLNLFLDGSADPSISAAGPYNTPSAVANSNATSYRLDGTTAPAAGTLVYSNGGTTVTLTNYIMYDLNSTAVTQRDVVGTFTTGASKGNDLQGIFTLDVSGTATPEPSSMLLVGLGAAVLGFARKLK